MNEFKNEYNIKEEMTEKEVIDLIWDKEIKEDNVKDEIKFEIGRLYLIKAYDHFTRHEIKKNYHLVNVLGVYIRSNDIYYIFVNFYYSQFDQKEGWKTPETFNIVKGTLSQVVPLNFFLKVDNIEEYRND